MEALELALLSPRVKSSPSSSAALDTSGSAPPVQAANSLASWRSCGDVVVGAPVQPAGKSPWTRNSERALTLAAASLCVVVVEACGGVVVAGCVTDDFFPPPPHAASDPATMRVT